MRLLRPLLLSAVLLPWILTASASAASTTPAVTQQGITVSPFLQKLSLAGFEESKTSKISLTNNTAGSRTFKVQVVDFGASGEFGGVAFLGRTDSYAKKHGLSTWMSVDKSQFMLHSHETIHLQITLRNDTHLQPGGHYGALLFNEVSGQKGTGNKNVAATPAVSSLVLATKLGGEQYDLHFDRMSTNGGLLKPPSNATLRFRNPGNASVVPRGIVTVEARHKVLAKGIINEDSAEILPDTYRQLSLPLTKVNGFGWWPTRYTLRTEYRYDGVQQTAVVKRTQLYLNPIHVFTLILLLTGVGYGLYQAYQRDLWKTIVKLRSK